MNPTETKSTVLLKHHLKALKLPTIHAECEKIAQRCAIFSHSACMVGNLSALR